jgi:hypothetical protein
MKKLTREYISQLNELLEIALTSEYGLTNDILFDMKIREKVLEAIDCLYSRLKSKEKECLVIKCLRQEIFLLKKQIEDIKSLYHIE